MVRKKTYYGKKKDVHRGSFKNYGKKKDARKHGKLPQLRRCSNYGVILIGQFQKKYILKTPIESKRQNSYIRDRESCYIVLRCSRGIIGGSYIAVVCRYNVI